MKLNDKLVSLGRRWVRWYFNKTYSSLKHHGVKGQKWGVKNGPPYPIKRNNNAMFIKSSIRNEVKNALKDGKIKLSINRGNQLKHTKSNHIDGKSYLDGDLDFAQNLIYELSGTGEVVIHESKGWLNKELVTADREIGVSVDPDTGEEKRTNKAMIIYSKKGSHIMPRR